MRALLKNECRYSNSSQVPIELEFAQVLKVKAIQWYILDITILYTDTMDHPT